MLHFNRRYFIWAALILLVEIFIALYVRDAFIRPYGGDILIIIFLYCLLKSFSKIAVKNAIFWVLVFAALIEGLQYIHFIEMLGIQQNKIAATVLGKHFEWLDLLCYILGAAIVLFIETVRNRKAASSS